MTKGTSAGKKKGGMRKRGRSRARCAAYRAAGKRELSKSKKLRRHLERQPEDDCAKKSWNNLPEWVKK